METHIEAPRTLPAASTEVTLDNWSKVYAEREHWNPVPGFIESMSDQYEEKLKPTVIFEDDAKEKIAAAVESGKPLVFNMSHGHELDTVLGAIALGRTAVRSVFNKIVVLAKDELFRVGENVENKADAEFKKAAVDSMALPVFQPKKWSAPKYRTAIVDSAKWLQGVIIDRMSDDKRKQHVFMHGEGQRNPTENKAEVQPMGALLARTVFGLLARKHDPVVIPIGIAYRDPEARSAEGAVVVVGSPRTEFPERQSKFSSEAQEDVQKLVLRGVEEIERLLQLEAEQVGEVEGAARR